MLRASLTVVSMIAAFAPSLAGEVTTATDAKTGWAVYTLRQGSTVARVVPEAGCNVYSIEVDGHQFLRVPENLEPLPGVRYGTPILYPTPNRVRNARFTYQGQSYRFPPNNGTNFIHGLVHSVAWTVDGFSSDTGMAELRCRLPFQPGSTPYERFPFAHVLRLTVRVTGGVVRWTFQVDNREGDAGVPFGIGLHPYFVYQGERRDTFLRVPATHLMESVELLPTGRLLPLEGAKYDLRTATSLDHLQLDDVFFGMTEGHPAEIDFRGVKRKIELHASRDFTHMVVYTPLQPYFCVENQTCSTDAHNLYDQGKTDVAHLLVCPAGQSTSAWVEYRFKGYE